MSTGGNQRYILNNFGKLSEVFQTTYSGIKHDVPSSVTMFIIFMDGVIDELKDKCVKEFLLDNYVNH